MTAHIISPGADWVRFSSLAGAEVDWLGKRGERWLTPKFHAALTRAFEEIWRLCPYGTATTIRSAGAYVPRPAEPGDRHATGTAFDLVAITWAGWPALRAPHAQEDARRYLAVECSLRRHVPQVLDWWTNFDHHGHLHLDDRASASGYSPRSAADVAFAQAALVHLYGAEIEIDGIEGPATRDALAGAWLGGVTWEEWLLETAKKGWGT